jgi:hypothetical protein
MQKSADDGKGTPGFKYLRMLAMASMLFLRQDFQGENLSFFFLLSGSG